MGRTQAQQVGGRTRQGRRGGSGRVGTQAKPAQGIVDQTKESSLMHRYGTIEEQVAPILFFASDESSYITGVNLPVDGGFSASGGVGRPTSEVDDAVAAAMTRF